MARRTCSATSNWWPGSNRGGWSSGSSAMHSRGAYRNVDATSCVRRPSVCANHAGSTTPAAAR
ncbi:Uncharacterised protein [Bordetella pertussis]|nr:Uncharacterised protein [Bordetella pertussis]